METLTSVERLHQILNKYEDPRTSKWFLMSSPIPTLALIVTYFILVRIVLPAYMKDRKPFQLKRFVLFYNFTHVVFSSWLFYGFLTSGWLRPGYHSQCFGPRADKTMLKWSHLYFMSKFLEFFDTIVFVLRKKENQVTSLHLYHHCIMPIGSWMGVKYAPDSSMTFFGLINSFIHSIMYLYYLLSAFGPKVQKYLWWKKYVTVLQLTQFVLSLGIAIQATAAGCLPTPLNVWNITQSILFFVMFSNFYKNAYRKKDAKSNHIDDVINKKYDINANTKCDKSM